MTAPNFLDAVLTAAAHGMTINIRYLDPRYFAAGSTGSDRAVLAITVSKVRFDNKFEVTSHISSGMFQDNQERMMALMVEECIQQLRRDMQPRRANESEGEK